MTNIVKENYLAICGPVRKQLEAFAINRRKVSEAPESTARVNTGSGSL
jgi:hypothetical protein